MSGEGEDEIDYELSYDVDDIELDLMYQDDGSEEEAKKDLHELDYLEQPQLPSATVSKPYFQPRQVWSRGRARGGRLVHRLGTRKPDQEGDGVWRQDRSETEENPTRTSGFPKQNDTVLASITEEEQCNIEQLGSEAGQSNISKNKGLLNTFFRNSNSRDISHIEQQLSNRENQPVALPRSLKEADRSLGIPIVNRDSKGHLKRSTASTEIKSSNPDHELDRLSRSREKGSRSQDAPKGRSNRSRSRNRRPKSVERKSKNKDRSNSRGRRSKSRDRRSKSRNRRSKSRNRRLVSRGSQQSNSRSRRSFSRGARSRSRGRRSKSKGRGSRNRELSRRSRSRSRDRRSRSREKRFSRDRRSRSLSLKRSRRLSHSSSRSRSRDRRRRRSYSRSKSSSPEVIAYKSKVELIDLDLYNGDRRMQPLDPSVHYGSTVVDNPVYPGQPSAVGQYRQSPPPFQNQYQAPPPPGIESYGQGIFSQGQPPPAPYISNPAPPAPYISGHTSAPPPQILSGPPPQSFPPPPVMPQQHGQFPHMNPIQPEEFGGYQQQGMDREFMTNRFGGFEGAPAEHFQSGHPQQPYLQTKDFGVHPKWSSTNSQSSSVLIYAQTGLHPNPASSNKVTPPPKTPVKNSGVEEERQNQKQTLVLQRDQYLLKNASLQKELTRLKDQRSELLAENSPETDRLLKENTKLQNEITQRLKAIENVIEMLTGLIKKDNPEEKEKTFSESLHKEYKPPPQHTQEVRQLYSEDRKKDGGDTKERIQSSPKRKKSPFRNEKLSPVTSTKSKEKEDVVVIETSPPPLVFPKFTRERSPPKPKPIPPQIKTQEVNEPVKPFDIPKIDSPLSQASVNPSPVNLIHYDPELHWCSLCNVFPKTAVDYLNHLHMASHKQQITVLKLDANPWHADEQTEPAPPVVKNAPTKRIPIRGVQFLVPSSGWYCRLCKTWIGDMHCAQEHLKGRKHTTNYSEYIAQNPHWEVDWLSDRTKSFERSSEYLSRLRDKNESLEPGLNEDLESEKAKFSALSDKLLAVLSQQNKRQRQSSTSSSSSSSTSEDERKKQKKSKRKKSKKKKKRDDSPDKSSKKNVERSPVAANYRQKNIEVELASQKSDLIANWMEIEKSEPSISIKLKQRVCQAFDKHKETGLNRNERYREEKGKPDDKNSRDVNRVKDFNKGFSNRKDQHYKKDFRDNREIKGKDQKEESVTKNIEQLKKNLCSQRVEEISKVEKKKSPPKVFQRPDDPLDRDSPEPVVFQERNKFPKSDKPQGKLWFPSKEMKDIDEDESFKLIEENPVKKKIEVKKLTQFTLPKVKLPFIGRMPILKKKTFDFKTEEALRDKSDNSDKTLIWPNIPSSQEGPEQDPNKLKLPSSVSAEISTSVIDISDNEKLNEDNLAEEDMDIANDDPEDIWAGESEKVELHQDFQDALDLLFPEGDDKSKDPNKSKDNESNSQAVQIMAYGPALPPNENQSNKIYRGDEPTQSFIGRPEFAPNVHPIKPPENLGQIRPVIPPLNEDPLMVNLRGPIIRNEAPPLMPPMGHPPRCPRGPPPLVNDVPIMSRPPPPLGTAPPMNPQFLGPPRPRGNIPMRPGVPPPIPPMCPRQMGPHIRPPDGLVMGPIMGPPPPLGSTLYSPEDEDEPVHKRKNAPSQRMRRHMQKKRAEAQSKVENPPPIEEKRSKYGGMDLSDLAMLGIDEDDSIIS